MGVPPNHPKFEDFTAVCLRYCTSIFLETSIWVCLKIGNRKIHLIICLFSLYQVPNDMLERHTPFSASFMWQYQGCVLGMVLHSHSPKVISECPWKCDRRSFQSCAMAATALGGWYIRC